MMIRHLHKQGMTKAEIARQIGVSRPTVYRHIARTDVGQSRPKRPSKLDPYRDYIRTRLEQYDLPATVLLREIRAQGYSGSITILRDFVRTIKERKIRYLTERFETLPGQQAQIDWGECGIIDVGGLRRKLYVFVFVLGFSRMLFARFTTSTEQHVLHALLREAFATLGIPRQVLVDNMKQAVLKHNTEGVTFHPAFLDFCKHHNDLIPIAAPPYWPRVKGKVERGVGYVKHSFLEGRRFRDLDDLNQQLQIWLDTVANVRIHGTTGQPPLQRYHKEQHLLCRLDQVPPYDTRKTVVRKVASDSHIRYGNVWYSVDPAAVGQTVTLFLDNDTFEARLGEALVAVHQIVTGRYRRVTLPEHAEKIRRLCRKGTSHRRRNVRFEQIATGDEFDIPDIEVDVRDLGLYESLLEVGG